MSGRDSKVRKLRDHVQIAHQREINSEQRKARGELSQSEKARLKEKWVKRAENIDRTKLHEVWNR